MTNNSFIGAANRGSTTGLAQWQAGRARRVGLAAALYLGCAGAAIGAWLRLSGVGLSAGDAAVCAVPLLVGAALALASSADVRQYLARIVAGMLFLPILLLFWAASQEPPGVAPGPVPRSIDPAQVFAGAQSVQPVALQGAGIESMQAAAFGDGTELRLMRFTDAAAAAHYLAFLGEAQHGAPFSSGARRGLRFTSPSMLPGSFFYAEQHGADLIELRARSVSQGLAFLDAQQVPLPVAVVRAAAAPERRVWPFVLAACLAHAAAFCGLIAWAGVWTTHVPPARGAPLAGIEQLRSRLLSLDHTVPTIAVSAASPRRIDVQLGGDDGARRHHHVALDLDAARRIVHVRERLGASGARPRDDAEASMRVAGDSSFDPARPAASRIFSLTLQATLIDSARLAATALQLEGREATLDPRFAASLDGEGWVTTLCALVTRSGWHWQPRWRERRER